MSAGLLIFVHGDSFLHGIKKPSNPLRSVAPAKPTS